MFFCSYSERQLCKIFSFLSFCIVACAVRKKKSLVWSQSETGGKEIHAEEKFKLNVRRGERQERGAGRLEMHGYRSRWEEEEEEMVVKVCS